MEKSISNRFYFDYNATSPLALKVKNFLAKGDFLFGNPSSLHHEGKHAKKFINDCRDFLFDLFQLSPKNFQLFFHSGATESINLYFKGNGLKHFKEKKKGLFLFSKVDHAAVNELRNHLEILGHRVEFFDVDKHGEFNVEELIAKINSFKQQHEVVYLNYTYINNETGVVWPLSLASRIKKETGCYIHIDAVQLVGKIKDWKLLSPDLDAYTFSGHKFGALKGIGFTFLKKDSPYESLLTGGNQQEGYRSGTQNALGVHSIKLALEEVIELFDATKLEESKNYIENQIKEILAARGEIVGLNAHVRNLNTFFVVMFGEKAEVLSMKFDMQGMDVSTGSACSSGIIKENRILMSMGYNKEDSRSAIRLSISPYTTLEEAKMYVSKISLVLGKS